MSLSGSLSSRSAVNVDDSIKNNYDDSMTLPIRRKGSRRKPREEDDIFDLPVDELTAQFPEADITDAGGNRVYPTSIADIVIHAEVVLPQWRVGGGGVIRLKKCMRRNLDTDDKVNGNCNTIVYDV
jgi:hypothetical protein